MLIFVSATKMEGVKCMRLLLFCGLLLGIFTLVFSQRCPRQEPARVQKPPSAHLKRNTELFNVAAARLRGSFASGLRLTFLLKTYRYKPRPKRHRCTAKQLRNAKRKDYRQLSKREMRLFHQCLNLLKRDRSSSGYNTLVRQHAFEMAPTAHEGVAFVHWHRHYLYIVENAIRSMHRKCRCVTIPYWDAACDEPLPSPAHAVQWTNQFWGTGNGAVTNGKLCPNWDVNDNCRDLGNGIWNVVQRRLTNDRRDYYSRESIMNMFAAMSFDELMQGEFGPMSLFEGEHGLGHCAVGGCDFDGVHGHLGDVSCSPTDPCFFLHHSFVDYLYEEWKSLPGRVNTYPPCPGISGGPGHCANAPMTPFEGVRNVDGIRENFYTGYEPRPSGLSCSKDSDCSSDQKLLWCDTAECFCKVKIYQGGQCTDLPNNACYCQTGSPYCDKSNNNNHRCRCN